MSLHASNQIMLKNIILWRKKLCEYKSLDHPSATIEITKCGTSKFIVVSSLADTGV